MVSGPAPASEPLSPPGDRLCRFAIISDPHVALPHTVWRSPRRLHMVEVGIPALEQVFGQLIAAEIDFLLMPGDLTQHGEPDNHRWLAHRLAQLPFPTYVIPGNHDFPAMSESPTITPHQFLDLYRPFGYQDAGDRLYYNRTIFPGIRLIGLNSNQVSPDGRYIQGQLDPIQVDWLDQQLAEYQDSSSDDLLWVMVHHNVAEHIPNQATHPLGQRYILPRAAQLRQKLREGGVSCVFTGHLHVQDIAEDEGLYAITTGSLIAYPHPYRIVTVHRPYGSSKPHPSQRWLAVDSHTVQSLPGWEDLAIASRQWAGDHSGEFMTQLLAQSSLGLSDAEAKVYGNQIRYLWADVSAGDRQLSFPQLPQPVRDYCENFGVRSRNNQWRFCANHIALRLD